MKEGNQPHKEWFTAAIEEIIGEHPSFQPRPRQARRYAQLDFCTSSCKRPWAKYVLTASSQRTHPDTHTESHGSTTDKQEDKHTKKNKNNNSQGPKNETSKSHLIMRKYYSRSISQWRNAQGYLRISVFLTMLWIIVDILSFNRLVSWKDTKCCTK